MTKQHLAILLQLADLARKTGQIPFDAMAAVQDAVMMAAKTADGMGPHDTLEIKKPDTPQ
jgi:hypothetical protein